MVFVVVIQGSLFSRLGRFDSWLGEKNSRLAGTGIAPQLIAIAGKNPRPSPPIEKFPRYFPGSRKFSMSAPNETAPAPEIGHEVQAQAQEPRRRRVRVNPRRRRDA